PQKPKPARFNCRSSIENPSGPTRCKVDRVARHNRPTFPVFGGISGSTRTTLNIGGSSAPSGDVNQMRLCRLEASRSEPGWHVCSIPPPPLFPPCSRLPKLFRDQLLQLHHIRR